MKKLVILAAFTGLTLVNVAQQLPLYSQYTAVPYLYNPALAGTGENVNASLIHRSQWKGIPGAPATSLFTAEGPIAEKNIGLAGTIFQDVTDITQRVGFYTSYSYKLKINEEQKVLFGLSIGAAQQRIDLSNAIIKDDNDPMLMYRQSLRKTFVDATLGVVYGWKTLEVGLCVPQLIGNKIEYVNTNSSSYYHLARHYMFSAKYTFDVNKEQGMQVYPLVLLRYAPGAPFQYDINAVFDWNKYGWAALTYRSNYAVGINIGFRLNNTLRAGYAYDFTVNTVKNYAGGAHEFFLGYTFGGKKEKEKSGTEPVADTKSDSLLNDLYSRDQQQKEEIVKLKEELTILRSQQDSLKKNSAAQGMLLANANDFKTETGDEVKKGYYVVVGAFKSESNANNVKSSVSSKYPESSLIFNKERGLFYVYVMRTDAPDVAEEVMKVMRQQYPGAWIFDMK